MIDLGKKKKSYYKIKLESGEVLNIHKPSQLLLSQIVSLKESLEHEEPSEAISLLGDILTELFNKNTNDMRFTKSQIQEMMDFEVSMEVLKDYMDFVQKEMGK